MRARRFNKSISTFSPTSSNGLSEKVELARAPFVYRLSAALVAVLLIASASPAAWAQVNPGAKGEEPSVPKVDKSAKPDKKISIDQLRKQYWNQGGELEVVQNRVYTKAQRLELSVGGGFLNSDPFLSVKSLNLGVGYYFSEMVGARLMAWKVYSSPSTAQDQLAKIAAGTIAGTNPPSTFIGAEANINAIYGKLALFGRTIIYYDLMFAGGGGQMRTESGSYLAPMGGLTQNVYLNNWLGLRLDYRLLAYGETVNVKAQNSNPAYSIKRTNWTNAILIGANFLF